MSWLNGLAEEKDILNQTQALEFTSEKLAPGFFTGALDVVGPNLERGFLEGAGAVESGFSSLWQSGLEGAAGLLLPEPKFGGKVSVTDAEQSSQETLGRGVGEAVIDLRPDPASVGMAGQIIGEAAAILPRTAAATLMGGPLAGAVAAGAPAGYSGKQVAMAEGIDESTATLKGVIDAATIGVGALLPAAKFVKPVLGDLGIAVGANVALGAAGRGLTGELLEGGGYAAQAEQYKAMDATGLATDAILGAAFFGIGRASMRRPNTQQVQAALTENNARHFDVETAPGLPATPRAAVAHQEALRAAIDQINRGEPVTLPESIHAADFYRVADAAEPLPVGRQEVMATARTEVAATYRTELEQQAAGVLPNVKDLKIELSTLQRTMDNLDATFRERAKAFQDQGLGRKKAEAEARAAIAVEREQLTAQRDGVAQSLEGNRMAEQARGELAAIDRGELPKAMEERVAQRAEEIAKGFERKPLAAGVVEANRRQSISQIARQEISRILDDLERTEPTLQAKALDIGQPRVAAEPATDATNPGKDATQPAKSSTSAPENATPGPKDATQPGAGAADPVVQVADEIMARADDIQLPTGAIDADGNPVTVSAKQMMAEADADIVRADQDSKGFAAAAACFLQRGFK